MKILVIPDIHLKPDIFTKAADLLKSGEADNAVILGDIPDDFNKQQDIDLYSATFDAAEEFQANFPEALWCYGNHDICYLMDQRESGFSYLAKDLVVNRMSRLIDKVNRTSSYKFIHKIDNAMFMHGGLCNIFVRRYLDSYRFNDVDIVLNRMNAMWEDMWEDMSPVWFRPQHDNYSLYKADEYIQVVGHTPVQKPYRYGCVISCDTFSTYTDGSPYGNNRFTIVDTINKTFYTAP